jgi:hypothetical protein
MVENMWSVSDLNILKVEKKVVQSELQSILQMNKSMLEAIYKLYQFWLTLIGNLRTQAMENKPV